MQTSTIKYEPMLASGWAFLKEGNLLEAVIRFARVTTQMNYDVWPAERNDEYQHAFDMSLFGDLVVRIISEDYTNADIRQFATNLRLGGAVSVTDDEHIPVRPVKLSTTQMHVVEQARSLSLLNRRRIRRYVTKYLEHLSK